MAKLIALALALPVLAGCARPWPIPSTAEYEPVEGNCYITLAEKECYRTPQPGQEYRLIGARVTAPR